MSVALRLINGGYSNELSTLKLITLPDGQPHINVPDDWYTYNYRYVIDVRGGSWNDLGGAAVAMDVFRRRGAKEVELWLPFLPGARQDRGVPLTCKVYADFINSLQADRVVCIDPHSPVMPALLNNLTVVGAEHAIDARFFKGVDGVICPDQGATKRTEAIADKFGLPVIYCKKKRDPQTGKLSGFQCDELLNKSKIYCVVDDICDGGGTFVGLANELDHPREKLRLWVTHGIFSSPTNFTLLQNAFSRVGCTNSRPLEEEKPGYVKAMAIEVLDITTLLRNPY